MEIKLKTPVEYIKGAWGIYTKKENFVFFARIMAVLVIATSATGFIISYFYPADYLKNSDFSNTPMLVGFIIISLISMILGLWSQSTQYFAILKIGSDEKEIFKLGFKNMGKLFLMALVVGLIVFAGALLLIIPAIIFGTWYSFSVWLVLDKGMKIGEALKISKAMVKGRFWKILGRSFAFGLFAFLISLIVAFIPYVGSLLVSFVAPLLTLPFYLLYKDLSTGSRLDDLRTA